MKKTNIKNSLLLILAALIWGIAFVAQKDGGAQIGSFTFNGVRSFLGGFVLIPVILLLDKKKSFEEKKSVSKKGLLFGGFCCGVMLFLGSSFQQIGLSCGADAGKSGFITALYMVLVPIFGLFLGKKLNTPVILSVIIAVAGMYLLCVNNGLSMNRGDLFVLICPVWFAFHILVIDHFVKFYDGVKLACIQFFTCGILSVLPMFIFENPSFGGILSSWLPLCYTGILSSGVAYTLQIVGQKDMNPTVASILLSLESVFAVLAGMLILGEKMNLSEVLGCVLMFIAIILTQLPEKTKEGQNG